MKPPAPPPSALVKRESEIAKLSRRSTTERTQDVVKDFYGSLTPLTVAGYRQDLELFAKFIGVEDVNEAAQQLFASSNGVANDISMRWKKSMLEAGNAPATINRRLSALRSLVRFGRTLGLITWTVDVRGAKQTRYRETAGPGVEAVQQMLQVAAGQDRFRATRDVAVLRLLYALGLRSMEVRELDLAHWNPLRGVAVRGKGKTEREWQTVPSDAKKAVEAWVKLRGGEPGPLFFSSRRKRFSRVGFWKLVSGLGRAIGLRVWPHGLRHTAITEALNVTGGDVRSVQKFSRHASVETVMKYDDARKDTAGGIASELEKKMKHQGGKP